MSTVFIVLILACIVVAAVSFFYAPAGAVLSFVLIVGIFAFIINKQMNIEDKIDMLLEEKDKEESPQDTTKN